MAIGNRVPELINSYNVYLGGTVLGISGEVELPSLESITETVNAAGVLGEVDMPATGHFGSMKVKIPFAILHEDLYSLIDTTKGLELTLRGSEQFTNRENADTEDFPVKAVFRGKATNVSNGKFVNGKKGEPEVEIEVSYYKLDVDGETQVELDKFNFVYKVQGKDLLERIKKNI